MRTFVSIAFVFLAAGAFAFDSEDWHGRRELLTREAERLRALYTNCVARAQSPAENVTVPVETFADGSVKLLVMAKKAQYFLREGLVLAKGVEIKKFGRDGAVVSRIEAASCVVDRNSKSGWAEGAASFTQGKTVFRGRGIYFSSPEGYVKTFAESDIRSEDLRFGGGRL